MSVGAHFILEPKSVRKTFSKSYFSTKHILLLESQSLIPIVLGAVSSQNLLQLRIICGLQEPECLELPLPQLTLPNEETFVVSRGFGDLSTVQPCVVGPVDSTEHQFLVLLDSLVPTFDQDDRKGWVHQHDPCQSQLCCILVDFELLLRV